MATRTLTDTATVSWDEATAGQVKANVVDGSIATDKLADDATTNDKLAEMVQATIKGRAAAAGTGNPTDLTAAQVAAILGFGVGSGNGFIDLTEIAAPSSPASNVARAYAADDGAGVTTLAMKDAAGNVVPLSHFLQAGTGATTRTQHGKLRDILSVKDFGAVGDNNGTPGNGTDDRAAFNAAFTYAATVGARVHIPAGKYRISNSIFLTENADASYFDPRASIVGDGARSTYLVFDNGSFDGLTVTGTSANNFTAVSGASLEGFTLYKTDGAGRGLVLIDHAHIRTEDVSAVAWEYGGYCGDVQESLFENTNFYFNLYGFRSAHENLTRPNVLTFIGCTIGNSQNWGLDVENAASLNYYGGSIESNGELGADSTKFGVRVFWDESTDPEGNQAALFSGVYFERNAGKGDIYITNSSASPQTYAVVGCNFNRGEVGSGTGLFGTNCVQIETSGGTKNTLSLIGNGFGGLPRSGGTPYVPNAARPYIGIVNPTQPLAIVDVGNRYTDSVETPVWSTGGGISVVRTESVAEAQHLMSNNADANPGPYSVLFRDSASPAATDFGGVVAFDFRNSAAAKFRGAQIAARIIDPTSTSEDIETVFFNYVAGTPTQSMGVANGLAVGNATYDGTGTIKAESSIKSASATAGVGYATGAGGTVTQATNKTTGVTLNKVCGQITMAAGTINAGAEATFAVTNSAVGTTDCVVVNHDSVGTSGAYGVFAHNIGAGSFSITVTNLSAGNLDEQIVLNFAVIKAVTS